VTDDAAAARTLLVLVAAAQFMVVLDATVVNVALKTGVAYYPAEPTTPATSCRP
jgi:hypothetical protein